ncbi:hypothetical protein F8388_016510 [Cannabis sativa]|uniref:Dynein light chain n=1 Tax=Cannabis sativa TaxID=3483 RepID=A0A7J6EQL2_CANSA|nr:hypothetical protein F8388_016510 [Cannabis sativa]
MGWCILIPYPQHTCICALLDYLLKVDEAYGPAWNCVVGKEFGSCITHLTGNDGVSYLQGWQGLP